MLQRSVALKLIRRGVADRVLFIGPVPHAEVGRYYDLIDVLVYPRLAMRLTDLQHDHHELTVSTTHAHLDHEHCIEVVILRGPSRAVKAFADTVISQPGVSHGQLHLVPMVERTGHGHAHLVPAAGHQHR